MVNIYDTNEFEPMAALRKAATHPGVEEIEGGGADPGRVFVHLKDGWIVDGYDCHSFSVGVALESEGRDMPRGAISKANREQLNYKLSLVVEKT
jgi:hypothetical protein